MNFMGLGFSFGAKDGGLGGAIKNTKASFGDLVGVVANLGNQGGQLTTQYEAMTQASAAAARKSVAGWGLSGKALDKASSIASGLAIGMKESEEVTGAAAAAMEIWGDKLKAFGIDSAATGVKIQSALGVPIKETAFNVNRMVKELGYTDKELGDLSKTMTGTGEDLHDMHAVFSTMPQLLDAAATRSNLAAQGFSKIGGKDTVKSILGAQRALYALTGDAKGAADGAFKIEQVLASSMAGFRDMFVGAEGELSDFLKGTSIVTGDVTQAFQAAEKGPEEFIKSFSKVFADLKSQGKSTKEIMSFFSGHMGKTMDPRTADMLLSVFRNVDDKAISAMNATKDFKRSLGDAGKEGWRSNMTLQESFDLVKGAGEAAFRKIGSAAANDFVKNTGKAFGTFNAEAKRLVEEGGPLGAIVTKMSEVSSLGAKAFLPTSIQPFAAILSHMGPDMLTSMAAITQLAPALLAVINPVTLLAAAFGGLFLWFKQTQRHVAAQHKDWPMLAKSAKKYETELRGLTKGTDKYTAKLAQLNAVKAKQAGIEKSVSKQAAAQMRADIKAKLGQFGEMARKFGAQAKIVAEETWLVLKELFREINWGEVWVGIKSSLKEAWAYLVPIAEEAWDALLTNFPIWMGKLREWLNTTALPWLREMWVKFLDFAETVPDRLAEFMAESGPKIVAAIKAATPVILDAVWEMVVGIWGLIKRLPEVFVGVGNLIKGAVRLIADAVIGIWDEVLKWLVEKFPAAAGPITAVFSTMKTVFKGVMDAIALGIEGVIKGFSLLRAAITGDWDYLFGHSIVPDWFNNAFKSITGTLENFLKFFEDSFAKVGKFISGIWDKVAGSKDSKKAPDAGASAEAVAAMQSAAETVKGYVEKALYEAVVKALVGAFDTSFKQISSSSKEFFKKETELFSKFTTDVFLMFNRMWTGVLKDTDEASKAAASAISGSLNDLKRLEGALNSIRSARAELATTSASKDSIEFKADPNKSWQDQLLEQSAWPDWYKNSYQEEFRSGMRSIVTAVQGISSAAPAAGSNKVTTALRTMESSKNSYLHTTGGTPPFGGT